VEEIIDVIGTCKSKVASVLAVVDDIFSHMHPADVKNSCSEEEISTLSRTLGWKPDGICMHTSWTAIGASAYSFGLVSAVACYWRSTNLQEMRTFTCLVKFCNRISVVDNWSSSWKLEVWPSILKFQLDDVELNQLRGKVTQPDWLLWTGSSTSRLSYAYLCKVMPILCTSHFAIYFWI